METVDEDDDDDKDVKADTETPNFETYSDDTTGDAQMMPEADLYDHNAFNKFISAQVLLAKGDSVQFGTVKRRKRDRDGRPLDRNLQLQSYLGFYPLRS